MSLPWSTRTTAQWREKLGLRTLYDPNQPRVPAGAPQGGQWTSSGTSAGQGDAAALANTQKIGERIEAAMEAARERYPDLPGTENAALKKYVSETLGKQTGLDPKVVSTFLKQWSISSGDSRPASVGIQRAAQKLFGLDAETMEHLPDPKYSGTNEAFQLPTAGPEVRALLTAERDWTQRWLRDNNITGMVTLYRGVRSQRQVLPNKADDYEVTMAPLSSWSTSVEVARQFAGFGFGKILTATVPVSRIAATPATGRGASYEHEVILIGGRIKVRVRKAGLDNDEVTGPPRTTPLTGNAEQTVLNIDADLIDADWPKRTPDGWNLDGTLDPETVVAAGRFGYDPTQPRVPAGSPQGGQWVESGTGGGTAPAAEGVAHLRDVLTGFRVVKGADLPEKVRTDLAIGDDLPLQKAAVEGIQQGLDDLKAASPGLHAFIQREVRLAQAHFTPPHAGGVTFGTPEGAVVVINSNPETFDRMTNPTNNFNLVQQVLNRRGVVGEERVREIYRYAIIHEMGHVLDLSTSGALVGAFTQHLLKYRDSLEGDDWTRTTQMSRLVQTSLGEYAIDGGPSESASEFLAAVVRGYALPPEWDDLKRETLRALKEMK